MAAQALATQPRHALSPIAPRRSHNQTTKEKGDALAAIGGLPLVGAIGDLDALRRGTAEADGVIHTAIGLDLSRIGELADEDRAAIETFGEVFADSTRPIVVTSGFLQLTGETATEEDRPAVIPAFPRASEQTAFALAERGLHASVVRNPRSVHGKGETHVFVPMLAAVAREKGVSAYGPPGADRSGDCGWTGEQGHLCRSWRGCQHGR